MNMESWKRCHCPHHGIIPLLIVLIGLTLLLSNLGKIDAGTASIIWPILLGLIGLQKMFNGFCKCCVHGCKVETK